MMPVLAPLHRAHDRSASSRGANGQALVQHRVLRDGNQLGVGAADRKRAGEIILGVIRLPIINHRRDGAHPIAYVCNSPAHGGRRRSGLTTTGGRRVAERRARLRGRGGCGDRHGSTKNIAL